MEEERKRKSSASAMYLLYAEGCCLLLLGTVVLVCGFIVNFHKDFDAVTVEAQFDYPQYWVGLTVGKNMNSTLSNYILPFLFTPLIWNAPQQHN